MAASDSHSGEVCGVQWETERVTRDQLESALMIVLWAKQQWETAHGEESVLCGEVVTALLEDLKGCDATP